MKNFIGKKVILSISGAAFLSACAAGGPIYSSFRSEAGALSDKEAFGSSIAANTEIMTRKAEYSIDLSKKFNEDVQTTVYFDFNSAELDSAARTALRVQADWIKQFPEIKFTVYGHTDRVGLSKFNRALGKRRAQAVVDYLIANGVDKSRLKAVVSEGEENPAIDARDRERLNRRAITEVAGFVAGHPAVLDGTYAMIVYRDYIESATIDHTLSTLQDTDTTVAAE